MCAVSIGMKLVSFVYIIILCLTPRRVFGGGGERERIFQRTVVSDDWRENFGLKYREREHGDARFLHIFEVIDQQKSVVAQWAISTRESFR